MKQKDPFFTKNLISKINRMVLRSLPLVPGPELYDLFIELKEGKESINSKIEKAYKSLNETSGLITELENDLKARTEKIKELKETYEEYSKLAEIEEEKIQPLLKQLEKTVGKSRNMERIISFFINLLTGILIFILGIWAGPKVKEWIWPEENMEERENSHITSKEQADVALFKAAEEEKVEENKSCMEQWITHIAERKTNQEYSASEAEDAYYKETGLKFWNNNTLEIWDLNG